MVRSHPPSLCFAKASQGKLFHRQGFAEQALSSPRVRRASSLVRDGKGPSGYVAMPVDRHNRLESMPFSYRATKDGRVFISWEGNQVMTLAGRDAEKFLNRIAGTDDKRAQLLMAKATGHFKHGNER